MLCFPEGVRYIRCTIPRTVADRAIKGMNQDWDITYIVDGASSRALTPSCPSTDVDHYDCKGMTTIEHALPIPKLFDDVLTLYSLSGTGATPTHVVNYGGAMGEQLVWAHEDVPNDPK